MKVQKKRLRVRPVVKALPVEKLIPTPDNRRHAITRASVESLAKSIAKDGVLQPIVVRAHPEKQGFWEIRAGERRWRAAKVAGLTEVPAIVRSLDDEAALSVTIAENLQRENLHPLEAAATVQQGVDRGLDLKAIAARLGKSPASIARLASLTKLSQSWRDAIQRSDSEASRLSVGHLELIARLPEETQEVLAENSCCRVFARGFPKIDELRRLIDGGLHSLRAMPWRLDDETLDPQAGACLQCPKRSGMHPLLFDGEDAGTNGKVSKSDRCLDPACFERKQLAFVERREGELRKDHPNLRLVQIGIDGLGSAVKERLGDRITRVYQPRIVKPGAKNATPVMQVDGPKAGTLVHLDFGGSLTADGKAASRSRPKDSEGRPLPMPMEEKRARLQKRRDAFLVAKVGEMLRSFTPETLSKTVASIASRTDAAAKAFDPLALVLAFGTSNRADRDHERTPWTRYEELRVKKGSQPIVTALLEVVQVWARRLGGSDTHHVTEQADDARRIGGILALDIAGIEAEAVRVIPTPKAWVSETPLDPNEEPPFDVTPPLSTAPSRSKQSSSPRARNA
jgi:ParB/RepB/Spo0J family partition protein